MISFSDPCPQSVVSSQIWSCSLLSVAFVLKAPLQGRDTAMLFLLSRATFLFFSIGKALAESVVTGNARPSQHPEPPLCPSTEPSWACKLGAASNEDPGPAGRVEALVSSLEVPQHPSVPWLGLRGCLAVSQDETSL